MNTTEARLQPNLLRKLLWLTALAGFLLSPKVFASDLYVLDNSLEFSIDHPPGCATSVKPLFAEIGTTQEELVPYERWCTAQLQADREVKIQIVATAFKIIPAHVSVVENDPDGFWKWVLETVVTDSIEAHSQRQALTLLNSGHTMQPPEFNPAGADACLTYFHDVQVVSFSTGAYRTDNSGLRCVVYDPESKIAATVLLEYIEMRRGAPVSRSLTIETEAQKTFRSLRIHGAKPLLMK